MLEYKQAVESILGVPLVPYQGYDVRHKNGVPDIRFRIHDAVVGMARPLLAQAASVDLGDASAAAAIRPVLWQQHKESLTHIRRQNVIANNVVRYARDAAEDDRIEQRLYDFMQYPRPVAVAPGSSSPLDALRSGMCIAMVGADRRRVEIARLLRHVGIGQPYCAEDLEPVRALLVVPGRWLTLYYSPRDGSAYQRTLGEQISMGYFADAQHGGEANVALLSVSRLASTLKSGAELDMTGYPLHIVDEDNPLLPQQYFNRLGSPGARTVLFSSVTPQAHSALTARFPDLATIATRQPAVVMAAPAPPETAHIPQETGLWRSIEGLRARIGCDLFTLQVLLGHLPLKEDDIKMDKNSEFVVAVSSRVEQLLQEYSFDVAIPGRSTVAHIAERAQVSTEEVVRAVMDIEEARGRKLNRSEAIIGARRKGAPKDVYFARLITRNILDCLQSRKKD